MISASLLRNRWSERDVVVAALGVAAVAGLSYAALIGVRYVYGANSLIAWIALLADAIVIAQLAVVFWSLFTRPTEGLQFCRVAIMQDGVAAVTVSSLRAYLLAFGGDGRTPAQRQRVVLADVETALHQAIGLGKGVRLESPLMSRRSTQRHLGSLGFRRKMQPPVIQQFFNYMPWLFTALVLWIMSSLTGAKVWGAYQVWVLDAPEGKPS